MNYQYNPYLGMPPMVQQPQMQQPQQHGPQTQTIQTIEKKPLQATCYFVKSLEDFNVDVLPGIYYLGINDNEQELYIKKINDSGNPEVRVYKVTEEKKEKTELQIIADRLSNIESRLFSMNGDKDAVIK